MSSKSVPGAHFRVRKHPEYERVYNNVADREFLRSISKEKLARLMILLSKERRRRYRTKSDRRYGNINRGFTEEELDIFLACCLHKKAKLAFQIQAYLGLRVGEVVKIRLDDLELGKRKLLIQTEKSHKSDAIFLHDKIYAIIKDWVDKHYDEIIRHDKYLLYSDNPNTREPNLSSGWLRNYFREVATLTNLNESYTKSEERFRGCSRRLHRLTTHSLRHYFVTKVYRETKDPIITQRLARHTDSKSTQVYVHTAQKDLDGALERVFEGTPLHDKKKLHKLLELAELIK